MLHISIKPEVIFEIAGFPVTNALFTNWVLLVIFLIFAAYYKSNAHKRNNNIVFFVDFVLSKMREFFKPVAGKSSTMIFPYIASIFIFVLLGNWMGLLPGMGSIVLPADEIHAESPYGEEKAALETHSEEDEGYMGTGYTNEEHGEEHASFIPIFRGPTADLNTTLALALFSFVIIQIAGFKAHGIGYLKKFINFSSPINFFIGILEIISEISKIISFAFRLFGNIFAGEVLLVVIAFLIPVLASFPFLLLEIFVGIIQALVFAMLTGVFVNVATAEHH